MFYLGQEAFTNPAHVIRPKNIYQNEDIHSLYHFLTVVLVFLARKSTTINVTNKLNKCAVKIAIKSCSTGTKKRET
jgi:hypothetical protein